MKSKALLIGLTLITAAAGACASKGGRSTSATRQAGQKDAAHAPAASETGAQASKQADGHGHTAAKAEEEVPAFVTDAGALKSLQPTLSPALFYGKQREGYQVAKEIPRTLAQLPCYCHCDRGFGHKSLHSCFVDDHAAHCAICIDEALVAYRLEKEEKLKPEQIRARIIAQFSKL
jgi:hypothetical protein